MKMNMKKIFSWGMMLAAAFTLTNCAKEIDAPVQEPESNGYPFEIIASTADTKTVNDGMSTKWVAEDQINLFHAVCDGEVYKNNGAFTVKDVESGNFAGNLCEELDPQEEYDWYALYPYSSYIKTPGQQTNGYTYIGSRSDTPQSQTGVDNMNHIAGEKYPLYGKAVAVGAGVKPELTMYHASTLLQINVTNTLDEELSVENISFTAPEGTSLVGTFYLDITGDKVDYADGQYVSNVANLSVSDATIAPEATASFYLAVKPFTAVNESELKIAVNGYEKTLAMSKDVTFTAGKIKTLNFAYDYVAPAGEQSVTFDFTSADELNALGVTLPDVSDGTNVTTLTKGDVTFVAEGGSTKTRVYNSNGSYDLRAYKGATLTFTVPTGYVISDIIVEGSATTGISKSTMPNNPVVLTVAADASTQKISTVTVKYIEGEVEAVPLTMTEIACVNTTANSLTFSWDAVTGAEGYKVSIDDGENYGDILTETSYTWVDLEPKTEYTLYVKAIGNGVNTLDSEAVSCTETTDEELVGVEEVEVVIDLTKQGYSNQQEVTTVVKNPINVEFKQSTASNPPAYYTSGTAVRVYGGGDFTVSSDKTIVKVALTFGTGDGSNTITTDCGSFSTDTWTGSSNSVKFTVGGTSGNRRIQKLTITYQKAVGEVILESRNLKFSSAEASATMGKSFTAPTLSGVISDVTYTSSNADVATVNATTGEVTLVAAGTTIITASAPETGEYEAGTASYTLKVSEASATQEYTYTWTATSGALGTTANGTVTKNLNGVSWTIQRSGSSGYTGWTSNAIQIGKNGASENLMLTTSGIEGTIKSISVECSSYQAKHNVSISVGGVSYVASKATSSWTTVSAVSGTGTSSGDIQINFTAGSGARAMYVKSIKIVYEN
mgnify:CR=1 FL=1